METTSTQFIQEFMENFRNSRRLLVAAPPQYHPDHPTMAPSTAPRISHDSTDVLLVNNIPIDTRVIIVLSVIFCGLICTLFLNSIVKFAFRCSSLLLADPSSNHRNPSRLKLANTGIKKKTLETFPVITYTNELEHSGFDSECVICLSEFGIGEKVKVLPKCNHCFHVQCIDKWLNSHSSCPTCRHCLIDTCQKIVKDNSISTIAIVNPDRMASDTSSSAPVQEVIVRIEGVVSSN
ncbi:RING-H2 finger protein ATL78-like [Lycium ferocissimum]|uniref:RING-H2 finger protein ATL78-like n=1 Tax=Lycium ferocissimum TaxID=112874 RepID=UPI002816467B|nr:RING-H2 finger protein ATL78-like [Lycium ferocissimum]